MTVGFEKAIVRRVSRRRLLEWGGASISLLLAACRRDDATIIDSGDVQGPDALDPITPIDDFYVVAHFGMMDISAEDWLLKISRNGEVLASIDYAFLETQSPREREHTLQCIESRPGWVRMSNGLFEGLPLPELLDSLGVSWREGTSHFGFQCADFYSVGLPFDAEDPPWLVWRMNGETLPQKHGFPARILAPNRYGWLNPKQVVELQLLDSAMTISWTEELEAYAEAVGLHEESELFAEEIRVQTVVVHPSSMQFVESGAGIRLLGKAFGGRDPVVVVEVSEDGGESYQEAELTYAPGPDRWTLWRHVWRPERVGTHLLHVRCRTAGGEETAEEFPENRIPYVGGMWLLVEVI